MADESRVSTHVCGAQVKIMSGRSFCRLIESRGWRLCRIKGSHRIYAREGVAARISVPVHGNTDLKRGLQRHLMRIAGIDPSEL